MEVMILNIRKNVMAVNLKVCLKVGTLCSVALVTGLATFAADGISVSRPLQREHDKRAALNPRGEVLSLSCSSCHGTDGKSVGIIPSFYGRSSEYIELALKAFKSGERPSTVMSRHAKGYSDDEIRLIADYFGRAAYKRR